MRNEELTLQKAIEWGEIDKARQLMAEGQRVDKKIDGSTKRRMAEQLFHKKAFDIVDELLKQNFFETDVYELDGFRGSIFDAIFGGFPTDGDSLSYLDKLLAKCDNLNDELEGESLLAHGINNGASVEVLKCFINAGCSTSYVTGWGGNLLHIATRIRHTRQPQVLAQQVQLLIDEGVDVNAKDVTGNTPILYLIASHKTDLMEMLLKAGAGANEANKNGETAFYSAVVHQLNLEMYNQLRKYEAPDFELCNSEGQSLLFAFVKIMGDDLSGSYGTLLERLLDDGADLHATAKVYGKEVSVLDLFIQKSADFLQLAIDKGKVDVNAQDNHGNTLLHKVCAYDINFESNKAKETYRKVKLLLSEGADPNATNDKDETPLMLASNDNLKVKTVELLMSKGAKVK